MADSISTITFERDNAVHVAGNLDEVREKLSQGGLVEFTDPYTDHRFIVNAKRVTTVHEQPGE